LIETEELESKKQQIKQIEADLNRRRAEVDNMKSPHSKSPSSTISKKRRVAYNDQLECERLTITNKSLSSRNAELK
jgi:hypothetical protein